MANGHLASDLDLNIQDNAYYHYCCMSLLLSIC